LTSRLKFGCLQCLSFAFYHYINDFIWECSDLMRHGVTLDYSIIMIDLSIGGTRLPCVQCTPSAGPTFIAQLITQSVYLFYQVVFPRDWHFTFTDRNSGREVSGILSRPRHGLQSLSFVNTPPFFFFPTGLFKADCNARLEFTCRAYEGSRYFCQAYACTSRPLCVSYSLL
jgi:hypothetical protein